MKFLFVASFWVQQLRTNLKCIQKYFGEEDCTPQYWQSNDIGESCYTFDVTHWARVDKRTDAGNITTIEQQMADSTQSCKVFTSTKK